MYQILLCGLLVCCTSVLANGLPFMVDDNQRITQKLPPATNLPIPQAENDQHSILINSGNRNLKIPVNDLTVSDDELRKAITNLSNRYQLPIESIQEVEPNVPDVVESPDKRIVEYNEWEYITLENEFDDESFKVAQLFSNDYQAVLSIIYNVNDKNHKNPTIALQLSGKMDNEKWHNFLCTENCLNIDFNIDGKKYPNIAMSYGGNRMLLAKQSKKLFNYIKTGETIKVRVKSVGGNYLIYTFEPNSAFDLQYFK